MKCWIVTPTLRDTESLVRLRNETLDAFAEDGSVRAVHFLVVDDSAGTDAQIIQLAGYRDVEVLTPPFNLGHQRAIVFGLRHLVPRLRADDVVVTMDSDGEDMPEDVPRLVGALEANVSLALAWRTKRSEPWKFRTMYVVYRKFFRILTGTTVRSGNFAAQRAGSMVAAIHHPSFDLCYSSTLLALARPTAFVPCARGRRFAGESRMNSLALMAHGVRMLMPFSERIAVRMLLVASTSSVALIAFLVLYATGALGDSLSRVGLSALVAILALFMASLTAFVVLFSGYSQTSAIATKGIGPSGVVVDAE